MRHVPAGALIKRKRDAKKVYLREHYDRASKKYCLTDYEDVGRSIFLSGDTVVFIDFEY
ncbi:hypothetical protein [Shimia sp.]|uniref:hypothetical protein n=1 Tax=Shimia sp. TaxID=1954381 RepID=UPI003BAB291C